MLIERLIDYLMFVSLVYDCLLVLPSGCCLVGLIAFVVGLIDWLVV